MKAFFTRLALGWVAVAGLALATGCEKDETKVVLATPAAPTLTASANNLALVQANSTQTAVTYTFTPLGSFNFQGSNSKYQPPVTYSLQVDKAGNNFAAPVTIATGNGPTISLTVANLNTSLNTLGIPFNQPTQLQVRLKADYAANAPLYSNALALTASSYKVCLPPNSDTWAVVGPAANGWPSDDNATDDAMTYDCDTKTYKLTRALKADELKFRANKSWTVNFGDDNADGSLQQGGKNIKITEAGVYTITLDVQNKKYRLVKQ